MKIAAVLIAVAVMALAVQATGSGASEADYAKQFKQFASDPARKQPNYLYHLLQVDQGASSEDIRRSFRQLAMRYHPDRMPGDASDQSKQMMAEIFKALNNANEILGDPDRRREYDAHQLRRLRPVSSYHGHGGGSSQSSSPTKRYHGPDTPTFGRGGADRSPFDQQSTSSSFGSQPSSPTKRYSQSGASSRQSSQPSSPQKYAQPRRQQFSQRSYGLNRMLEEWLEGSARLGDNLAGRFIRARIDGDYSRETSLKPQLNSEPLGRGASDGYELAMVWASLDGRLDIVQALNAYGIPVITCGNDPLIAAIIGNSLPVARFLLQNGADANRNGGEPLLIAAENGSEQLVEALVHYGALVAADDDAALKAAAKGGHGRVVEYLLKHGAGESEKSVRKAFKMAEMRRDQGTIAVLKQFADRNGIDLSSSAWRRFKNKF